MHLPLASAQFCPSFAEAYRNRAPPATTKYSQIARNTEASCAQGAAMPARNPAEAYRNRNGKPGSEPPLRSHNVPSVQRATEAAKRTR